jgi:hypothetical protein
VNTINAIRDDASGSPVSIHFSNLDIVNMTAMFDGNWGEITLTGSITSAPSSGVGTIHVQGPSITSTADIMATGAGSGIGNLGTGTINIIGGTVSATAGRAIFNNNTGRINISGTDTLITSANTSNTILASGTIAITGTQAAVGTRLSITGGTIRNTVSNANSRTIYFNSSNGVVEISGGTISAVTGQAIHNANSGRINISGTETLITSANVTAAGGTIVIEGMETATTRLEITGGTVQNTLFNNYDARVINNISLHGRVEISGGLILAETTAGVGTHSTAVSLAPTSANSTSSINITGGTLRTGDLGYAIRGQRTNSGTGSITIGGDISGRVILSAQSATVRNFLTIAENWTGTINSLNLRINIATVTLTQVAWWDGQDVLRAPVGGTITNDQFGRVTLGAFWGSNMDFFNTISSVNRHLVLEGDPPGNTAVLRPR